MSVQNHTIAEEEAFRVLYDTYKNRVYGYVLSIVHASNVAEDITQELFIQLWMKRDSLNQINDLEHYLFTMARNRTLNYLRKAANDARIMKELQSAMTQVCNNVEEEIGTREHLKLVDEAIQQLSPRRQLVFKLSRYNHLKLEEIAEQLGLSRNTVKNHLVEARRFIRTYLLKHGIGLLLLVIWFPK